MGLSPRLPRGDVHGLREETAQPVRSRKRQGNKQDEEEILGSCAARGWEGELPGSPAGCSQGFSEGSWF